jgi:hypothetical protein
MNVDMQMKASGAASIVVACFVALLSNATAARWPWKGNAAGVVAKRRSHAASPLYLINPASRGSVRLISGMQMMSSRPANSASMYGT